MEEIKLVERKKLANHDHDLARFLRSQGWDGGYQFMAKSTTYYRPDSRIIAVVFVNNKTCTYTVWTQEV